LGAGEGGGRGRRTLVLCSYFWSLPKMVPSLRPAHLGHGTSMPLYCVVRSNSLRRSASQSSSVHLLSSSWAATEPGLTASFCVMHLCWGGSPVRNTVSTP